MVRSMYSVSVWVVLNQAVKVVDSFFPVSQACDFPWNIWNSPWGPPISNMGALLKECMQPTGTECRAASVEPIHVTSPMCHHPCDIIHVRHHPCDTTHVTSSMCDTIHVTPPMCSVTRMHATHWNWMSSSLSGTAMPECWFTALPIHYQSNKKLSKEGVFWTTVRENQLYGEVFGCRLFIRFRSDALEAYIAMCLCHTVVQRYGKSFPGKLIMHIVHIVWEKFSRKTDYAYCMHLAGWRKYLCKSSPARPYIPCTHTTIGTKKFSHSAWFA